MRTNFIHDPRTFDSCKQINSTSGRCYEINSVIKYPSITTVLAANPNRQRFLAEWRSRIGVDEAKKISSRSSKRGTRFHAIVENFLKNSPLEMDPFEKFAFDDFKSVLTPLDKIVCQEQSLFSHRCRVAGQVDCIAEYENELAVVDFKTSSKPKRLEWIEDYFIQTCFYAHAYNEMVGPMSSQISKLVILISVEGESPQVFVDRRQNWTQKLVDQILFYRQQYQKVSI